MREVPSGVWMGTALLAFILAAFIAGMDTTTVLKIGGYGLLILVFFGRW